MRAITLEGILNTESAMEILITKAVTLLADHFNCTAKEVRDAYVGGAENVQTAVNDLVLTAAKKLVEVC